MNAFSLDLALGRAIRLRRPEDAVYWYERASAEMPKAKILKTLLQCALRDNLNIDVMAEAVEIAADLKLLRPEWVCRLAKSEKLWSHEQGQKLAILISSVQSDTIFRSCTDDELDAKLTTALSDFGSFWTLLQIAHEWWDRYAHGMKADAWMMISVFKIRAAILEPGLVRPISILEALFLKNDKTLGTETLWYVLIAWLCTEAWGQDFIQTDGFELARVAIRLRSAEPVPSWASVSDRRFESRWIGCENMALMAIRDGGLFPENAGELLLEKDGRWVPRIREEGGLYFVQSESNPKSQYEINLSVMSCNCRAFMQASRPCKHVEAARLHMESECPFEVTP